jgi:tetratricopeptide (TPR) repeat protein
MNTIYHNAAVGFWRLALFFLLLLTPALIFGQYKGSPVKKSNLIQALNSRQFQSRDIVQIITENGVDFKLTPIVQNELVAAGARPSVIEAVRNNYRDASQSIGKRVITKNKVNKTQSGTGGNSGQRSAITYNHLLERAIDFYDNKKNRQAANDSLQEAVKLQPENPRAYQLLGFMNLYGARNFDEAERYWKTAVNLGGSAVLRVIHDHNGLFTNTCSGSLYIAKDIVRYESDNNIHTFETTDKNIKSIKVNSSFKRLFQLKRGSFKIVLNNEDDKDGKKFNFAPVSGDTDVSKMIIRLIGKNSN